MLLADDVFKSFAFYGSLSLFKMMGVAMWTVKARVCNKSFLNEEDAAKWAVKKKGSEECDRIQRAHRNDVENILPFIGLGLFYCMTGPDPQVAIWHFRIFAAARILHTISYLSGVSKPRGLGFISGYLVCVSMAVQNLKFYFDSI